MRRSKLGLIGICALGVGLLGPGAVSGQAANWLILNSKGEVKTGTELPATLEAEIDGVTASLDTHSVKVHLKSSCSKFSLIGGKLEAGGALTKGAKIKLEGCKVFNAATGTELSECGVKTPGAPFGTVESFKSKGQLQTNGEIKLEPETGTKFAELEYEASCTLPSPSPISGVLFLEDCEGKAATHLVKHLFKQGAGTSLFVGTDTAEHLETALVGSIWVFLGGEHKGFNWGAVFP
jgi:hypothetical protein